MIWRHRQHLGQGSFGRRGPCRPVVSQKNTERNEVNKCGADQRLDIAGIERERMFIKAARLQPIELTRLELERIPIMWKRSLHV
jgi:hypothetical protein